MPPIYGFLFINVITPLHNGSGEGLGAIDRQIMRERTTGFPIVQSSSIKGVLREEYKQKLKGVPNGGKKVFALFGPEPQASSDHAGAVSFGDAQILAFPVRSLKGPWVWITSPLVLTRFARQVDLAGMTIASLNALRLQLRSGDGPARICPHGAGQILVNNQLLLEEFPFQTQNSPELADFAAETAKFLYPALEDQYLHDAFARKLVLLPDDKFTYFVKHATEVVPNIRIGDSGTTETGSLRYSEYLPAESILYSLVTCGPPRRPENKVDYYQGTELNNENDVERVFRENLTLYIQLGGDETTGKGLVALQYRGAQEVAISETQEEGGDAEPGT